MTCHVARRIGEFERRLRRDRWAVCRTLATTEAELVGREPHHAGELMDDAATETACRLLARLQERDRRELTEIDAAGERLSTGTFGVCQACDRPIPFGRLRALPAARLCVKCEEMTELTTERPGVAGMH
jgi:RNA polymerase-binding protein DksA